MSIPWITNSASSNSHCCYLCCKCICLLRRSENFPPEVAAEHARIANEYNRQMFKLRNKFDKDLALKTWLMNDARKALPTHLQEHANTFNDTPMPPNRPFPKWHTPPIKGFNSQEYVNSSGEEDYN